MTEPGINRVDWHNIPGATDPALASTASALQTLINTKIKPATIWDPTKYINMWVTDEMANGPGLLGYATFPAGTTLSGLSSLGTSTTDGFWAYTHAFGSALLYPQGTYDPTYKYGRTCTHEIGHWLGLRHIWGDGGTQCGADDFCNDTPPQKGGSGSPKGANYGCPTYPFQANGCTFGGKTSTNGDMFMNFMDYTDDACMYMFTNDQTTRIQTAMSTGTHRKTLGTHGLCSTTGLEEQLFSAFINYFPNPTTGSVYFVTSFHDANDLHFTVTNTLGRVVLQQMEKNVVGNTIHLNLEGKGSGVYFVNIVNEKGFKAIKKIIVE